MAIWDDHEVEDNYAGSLPGDAALDRRGVPFPEPPAERLRRVLRAHAADPRARRPQPHLRLDAPRGQRGALPARRAPVPRRPALRRRDARVLRRGRRAAAFLGDAQKQWLKDALVRSTATWKLIGNQVMIMAFDVTAARNVVTVDSWDGYGAERADLANFIGGANPTGARSRTSRSSRATSTRSSPAG
jgi:alkaline phosphatase D